MVKQGAAIILAGVCIYIISIGAMTLVRTVQTKSNEPSDVRNSNTVLNSIGHDSYFRGVPLEKARALGWPGIAARLAAARKFPSLAACAVAGVRNGGGLDIDWRKVDSDLEVEVCLSRVAQAVGAPSEVAAWLKSHGFQVIAIRSPDESTTSIECAERDGTVVEAFWPVNKNGPLARGGWMSPLVQRTIGHGTSINIFISHSGKIISTNAVTNIL